MENLYFQNQEHFDAYIKNLECIGSGSDSFCYKTPKGLVLKHLCGISYEPKTKEELLQFKDIVIKNYIFAQALVYMKDEIVGILMPYVTGKTLENGIYNIQIKTLIKAFDELVEATKKLSSYGVSVFDVCDINMMYNRGRFYLIDTINYYKSDKQEELIFKENMYRIFINIYEKIFTRKVVKFLESLPETKDFKKDIELITNPSIILEILQKKLNEYFGCEIKTIAEASKKINY